MKIKYRNNDIYIESNVSNLNDLEGLSLNGGYIAIAFLIPFCCQKEAVKQVNENVVNQNIQLKATGDAIELICGYANIAELKRDLMDYQRALELYIDDLEPDRQIDRRLRLKIMWLYLHINGKIFNLLLD